ncbi:MAG TPA: CPBP family intramembrane glutamic endopeptidase [Acidobacteriaceae bacterium]
MTLLPPERKMPDTASTSGSPLTRTDRVFAAIEVTLGGAVVLAHNVYRIVPNEVPILVAILWISLLVRRKRWSSVGLSKPTSWRLTTIVALCCGVLLQLKDFVTEPLAHLIWHQTEKAPAILAGLHHHQPLLALKALAIVWTFAAFGEEFAYRALLLRRTADALNGSRAAYVCAVAFSSVLFGFGHFFKGPTGVFDSTCSGLILGGAYVWTRRNLWAGVLAHGLGDSIAVVFTYVVG